MADVKHVAAYDQEQYPNGGNNETVSQQALQELYLAPFQAAIAQSAPASFMCSYAVVNGASSCANAHMLRNGLDTAGELRRLRRLRLGRRRSTRSPTPTAAWTSRCRSTPDATDLGNALAAGTFSQSTLNAIVARILTQMFAFGVFDNPASGSLSATVTSAAHQQTALQLGQEGTVLLKNNGLLPLNPNPTTAKSIAVIGTDGGAGVELAGGGSGGGRPARTRSGRSPASRTRSGRTCKVTYTPGDDNGTANIPQAVAAAQAATYAIIYVSAPEGEESDLKTLNLSAADETMISNVAAANPNTIVVINSGSPVVMPWLNSVAGVFENWYGGGETGAAVGRADLRHGEPVGQAAGDVPELAEPGPGADHRAVAGHPDRPDLQRGREHRLPLVPVAEHHPGLPVRIRPVLHQVLLLQPGRRRLQRQRHRPR